MRKEMRVFPDRFRPVGLDAKWLEIEIVVVLWRVGDVLIHLSRERRCDSGHVKCLGFAPYASRPASPRMFEISGVWPWSRWTVVRIIYNPRNRGFVVLLHLVPIITFTKNQKNL